MTGYRVIATIDIVLVSVCPLMGWVKFGTMGSVVLLLVGVLAMLFSIDERLQKIERPKTIITVTSPKELGEVLKTRDQGSNDDPR